MASFSYLEPGDLIEAIGLLEHYGDEARLTAGNTDLLIRIKRGIERPRYLIGLHGIPGLAYIQEDESGSLRIGAMTTMRALERSSLIEARWPAIAESAGMVGSIQIRNLATLGGNLCNASPAADTAPALIALGARVRLVSRNEERTLLLEDFFCGPGQTCLGHAELLVEILIPPTPDATGCVYLRHALRAGPDCSVAGVAAAIQLDEDGQVCQGARLVLGAVAPTPMRARQAESYLVGHAVQEQPAWLEQVAFIARQESRPISDVRSSCEYRQQLVDVLARRAIALAIDRARWT